MWWWGGDHMGAGGWVAMGFMILFWIAVLVGIVLLVRYLIVKSGPERGPQTPHDWDERGYPRGRPPWSNALSILEERYARGEIDQEEFLRRKADIEGRSETR